MTGLLSWLGVRHHRYLILYVIFTLCALAVMGQQVALGWPLTSLKGASDLTVLSSLSTKTLLTRLASTTLDYGMDWQRYLMQVRLEELVVILGAVLFTRKTEPYPTHWIVRLLFGLEIGLNLGLALIFNHALSTIDVESVVSAVVSFGWIYTLGSMAIMIGLTLEGIRLCFIRYSD